MSTLILIPGTYVAAQHKALTYLLKIGFEFSCTRRAATDFTLTVFEFEPITMCNEMGRAGLFQHEFTVVDGVVTVYSVEWSYPFSSTAKNFGHAKDGCWTVSKTSIKDGVAHTTALSGGYSSKDAALKAARSLAPEHIRHIQEVQKASDAAQTSATGFSSL